MGYTHCTGWHCHDVYHYLFIQQSVAETRSKATAAMVMAVAGKVQKYKNMANMFNASFDAMNISKKIKQTSKQASQPASQPCKQM